VILDAGQSETWTLADAHSPCSPFYWLFYFSSRLTCSARFAAFIPRARLLRAAEPSILLAFPIPTNFGTERLAS
jgi:hypothetical protein